MPIYVYENIETGERLEEYRNIADRDLCPPGCRRVFVNPIATVGFAQDPDDECYSTMKTLSKLEDKIGIRELERQSGYSTKQLKHVWDKDNEPAYKPLPTDDEILATA